jgi:hypothetical protein
MSAMWAAASSAAADLDVELSERLAVDLGLGEVAVIIRRHPRAVTARLQ